MIAVDSSSLIAFLGGEAGADVDALEETLSHQQAALPPVVLTELLGVPALDTRVAGFLRDLPLLEIEPGYWERAAATRAKIFARGRRAPLADTLIAQSAIDHDAPLITRDADFRHFARFAGLRLV